MTVSPGQTVEVTDRFFAGAKEVELLDTYGEWDPAVRSGGRLRLVLLPDQADLPHSAFFYQVIGNYGVAILLLTLLVKLLFYPLANKSYRAMSK